MTYLKKILNKLFVCIVLILTIESVSFGQVSQNINRDFPLNKIQGVWKESSDVSSYMIFEGHAEYDVVMLNSGTILVNKYYCGFANDVSGDSLDIRKLGKSGKYFVVFTRSYKKEKFLYDNYKNFLHYEYDLGDDYFLYIAEDPISLSKINSLPEKVKKVFEEKRKTLDNEPFPNFD